MIIQKMKLLFLFRKKINKTIRNLLIFVYYFVKIISDYKMLYFRNELDKNKYSTYQLNKAIKNKPKGLKDNIKIAKIGGNTSKSSS